MKKLIKYSIIALISICVAIAIYQIGYNAAIKDAILVEVTNDGYCIEFSGNVNCYDYE